jgi:hypothetical protein
MNEPRITEDRLRNFQMLEPSIALEQAKIAIETEDPTFDFVYSPDWATHNATQDFIKGTGEWKLKWGEVATLLRHHLYKLRPTLTEGIEIDDMRMRLNLIRQFGINTDHQLLDPQYIIIWFESKFRTNAEETIKLIREKQLTWSITDLIYVRKTRQKVRILVLLHAFNVEISPQLMEWVHLAPTLPKLELEIVAKLSADRKAENPSEG